jgi:imidazolonepropionase-like amidohydrolase
MDQILRGTLLPSPTEAPIFGGYIGIRNGKIDFLSPSNSRVSEGPVEDFGNQWILPGLIDTHCHMVFRGDGHWSDGYIDENTTERLLLIAAENGRRALRAGITTLRDLGAPGRILFELRHAAESGDIVCPRLLLSGPPLTPTGGHGWDLGGEVDSPEDIVRIIRQLGRDGADVIKVMASGGGTKGTSAGSLSFTRKDLQLMADTAHARGLPIVAHATCPDAVRSCAEAEFDGLEHVNFWEGEQLDNRYCDDTVALLAEKKVVVTPTLQASYRTARELRGQTPVQQSRRHQLVDDAFTNFKRMLHHDLAWVAGSDAGYMINPFGDLALGLRLMVDNGMTTAEALASATTRSAAALGLSEQVGQLIPGFDADILVIESNPLESIDALQSVRAVYTRGQRVR